MRVCLHVRGDSYITKASPPLNFFPWTTHNCLTDTNCFFAQSTSTVLTTFLISFYQRLRRQLVAMDSTQRSTAAAASNRTGSSDQLDIHDVQGAVGMVDLLIHKVEEKVHTVDHLTV